MVREWYPSAIASDNATARTVSRLEWAGIAILPIFFSWLTLRKGHSSLDRYLAFIWLVIFLMLTAAEGRSPVPESDPFVALGKPPGLSIGKFVASRVSSESIAIACLPIGLAVSEVVSAYDQGRTSSVKEIRSRLAKTLDAGDPIMAAYGRHLLNAAEHNIKKFLPAYRKFGHNGFAELIMAGCLDVERN